MICSPLTGWLVAGPGTESKLLMSVKGLLLLPLHHKLLKCLMLKFTVTNQGALCPALARPGNNQGSHGLSQCLYGIPYHPGFGWSGSWLDGEAPSTEMALASHLALYSPNGRMVCIAILWGHPGASWVLGQLLALGPFYRNLCPQMACGLLGREGTTRTLVIDTI